jgi:hypothetical protein
MTADALLAHLEWMDNQCFDLRPYSLTPKAVDDDGKSLEIVRAAHLIVPNFYMNTFTKVYCYKIRADASPELMVLITQWTYLANDPVYDYLKIILLSFARATSRMLPIQACSVVFSRRCQPYPLWWRYQKMLSKRMRKKL